MKKYTLVHSNSSTMWLLLNILAVNLFLIERRQTMLPVDAEDFEKPNKMIYTVWISEWSFILLIFKNPLQSQYGLKKNAKEGTYCELTSVKLLFFPFAPRTTDCVRWRPNTAFNPQYNAKTTKHVSILMACFSQWGVGPFVSHAKDLGTVFICKKCSEDAMLRHAKEAFPFEMYVSTKQWPKTLRACIPCMLALVCFLDHVPNLQLTFSPHRNKKDLSG